MRLLCLQFLEVEDYLYLELFDLSVLFFRALDVLYFLEETINPFHIYPTMMLVFACIVYFLADLNDQLVQLYKVILLLQLPIFLLYLRIDGRVLV